MKVALAIVLAVALCSQISLVTCAPDTFFGQQGPTTTTTTAKPWTQKVKDGLGTFFHGVGIATAVGQGIKNARGQKVKPGHHGPDAAHHGPINHHKNAATVN